MQEPRPAAHRRSEEPGKGCGLEPMQRGGLGAPTQTQEAFCENLKGHILSRWLFIVTRRLHHVGTLSREKGTWSGRGRCIKSGNEDRGEAWGLGAELSGGALAW